METNYGQLMTGSAIVDPDPIIVTGQRSDGNGFWFDFFETNIEPPRFGDDHIALDPGEVPTYLDFLEAECLADLTTDMIARQVEALIKAQPDWNSREYAAVIYMVGNEIRMGPLLRGETVAEAENAGRDRPRTVIVMPADLGDGVILAIVHSHPDIGYNAEEDLRNHYPSGGVGGDYHTFEQLVSSDPRFSNSAAFAHYILGPDGILREFNASDGRVDQTNDTDPVGRSNLAKDRPCLPN